MNRAKLIRSKKRYISIQVDENAQVVVRAPLRVSKAFIQEFLGEKQEWIEGQVAAAQRQLAKHPPKRFVSGEKFLFLGQELALEVSHEASRIEPVGDRLIFPSECLISPKRYLKVWYKKQALRLITERVAYHASIENLRYKKISLTEAKSRWGSCAPDGSLRFSWRLILLPTQALEYVVIHELHHLTVPNHSKDFWAKVARTMPSYKEAEAMLKAYGKTLYLQMPL